MPVPKMSGCCQAFFSPLAVLVIVEKFTFRIPRIAQKVERFYKSVVEESLFGKVCAQPNYRDIFSDMHIFTQFSEGSRRGRRHD